MNQRLSGVAANAAFCGMTYLIAAPSLCRRLVNSRLKNITSSITTPTLSTPPNRSRHVRPALCYRRSKACGPPRHCDPPHLHHHLCSLYVSRGAIVRCAIDTIAGESTESKEAKESNIAQKETGHSADSPSVLAGFKKLDRTLRPHLVIRTAAATTGRNHQLLTRPIL